MLYVDEPGGAQGGPWRKAISDTPDLRQSALSPLAVRESTKINFIRDVQIEGLLKTGHKRRNLPALTAVLRLEEGGFLRVASVASNAQPYALRAFAFLPAGSNMP